MKKLITSTLLIAFCSVFVIPQNVIARGGGDTADSSNVGVILLGGALIIAAIIYVGLTGSEKTKLDLKNEFAKRLYLIPTNTRIDSYSSHLSKDEGQTIALYVFKMKF